MITIGCISKRVVREDLMGWGGAESDYMDCIGMGWDGIGWVRVVLVGLDWDGSGGNVEVSGLDGICCSLHYINP